MFQKVTGYNNQDLKYSNYEIIMNDLVKKWHGQFVSEFAKSGQNVILDKKLNQFVKHKNGYVLPVQILVKNHYSKHHGFTFIAFINKIKDIQMDGSLSMGVPVENLMFLLCDNIDGKVYNVSKSCASVLGIKKEYLLNSSQMDFELRLGQIAPVLDIPRIKELAYKYNSAENVFAGMFKLDLNTIA